MLLSSGPSEANFDSRFQGHFFPLTTPVLVFQAGIKEHYFCRQLETQIEILALPLVKCMAMCELLFLPEPQFSHLYSEPSDVCLWACYEDHAG